MKFFSRELCEKLQKLGCKSENDHHYHFTYSQLLPVIRGSWDLMPFDGRESIPAFTQNDFTGCHEQARENARIVWGTDADEDEMSWGQHDSKVFVSSMQKHRRRMIDAIDAEEYLTTTVKKC